MTKVTTRNYRDGECYEEVVQQFDGEVMVSETITEYTIGKVYRKQSPESIKRMLATRAAKKAQKESQ